VTSADWQLAGNVRIRVDGKHSIGGLVAVSWDGAIVEHCWRLSVGVENDVERPI